MVERIAAGIYFITTFFDDKEPLRWKLRTMATNLVSDALTDKKLAIKEISSQLELAKKVGLVSDTNYNLLLGEVLKLKEDDRSLGVIMDIEQSLNKRLSERVIIKDKKDSVKKNTRQEAILSIIKNKKEVMIKDISSQVKGYSDKTIQRDVLGMVKDGILIKSGEKRWSRYSLA